MKSFTLNRRLSFIVLGVFILLAVPLIAMQFTNEVNWTVFDFAIAGTLLFTTGFCCSFLLEILRKRSNRLLACAIVLSISFAIWVELAVGLFR